MFRIFLNSVRNSIILYQDIIFNFKGHISSSVFKIFYVSTHLRQYNIPLSPCSTLLDTTIFFISTESKATGCLETWNSFLLTSIFLNFNVFSPIFMLYQKVNIVP